MNRNKALKIAKEMAEYKPNSTITAFELDDSWIVSLDGTLLNERTWAELKQTLDNYRSGDALVNWRNLR